MALAALAAADLVHADPVTGRVRVAYPFSGMATPIGWNWPRVQRCMRCAPGCPGRPPNDLSQRADPLADPTSGHVITVEVDDHGWRWQPVTTVVLAGTGTVSEACGSVADCCCPYINFHVSLAAANTYRQAHPAMTAELLDQPEAVAAAERIFGGLLHPRPSHGPAGFLRPATDGR